MKILYKNHETSQPKLEFIFSSGRSTLQMQNARNLVLSTLQTWLRDIQDTWGSTRNHTNTDCALVSAAFYRIENALKYDHNIQVPYHLVHQKAEARLAWLANTIIGRIELGQ